jgi:hypothetical protein
MKGGGRFRKEEFKTDEDGYGFWTNNKIGNADERSLGPKEKENGKLARILSKNAKKERKKRNTLPITQLQRHKHQRKEGRKEGSRIARLIVDSQAEQCI